MNLIDFQLGGDPYTWFKEDNQLVAFGIDRILIQGEWNDRVSIIKQSPKRLFFVCFPIALLCGSWDQNKSTIKIKRAGR